MKTLLGINRSLYKTLVNSRGQIDELTSAV